MRICSESPYVITHKPMPQYPHDSQPAMGDGGSPGLQISPFPLTCRKIRVPKPSVATDRWSYKPWIRKLGCPMSDSYFNGGIFHNPVLRSLRGNKTSKFDNHLYWNKACIACVYAACQINFCRNDLNNNGCLRCHENIHRLKCVAMPLSPLPIPRQFSIISAIIVF